jgi:hypothetical protein
MLRRWFGTLLFALVVGAGAGSAHAERYGFCEDSVKNGTECFLVMTQETYRKCRIVHTMMIIEYGFLESYLPDNHGEKLNFCIEKHNRGVQEPYQAALKEQAAHKDRKAAVEALYARWHQDLGELIPAIVETPAAYEERIAKAGQELADDVEHVKSLLATATTATTGSTATGKGKRH